MGFGLKNAGIDGMSVPFLYERWQRFALAFIVAILLWEVCVVCFLFGRWQSYVVVLIVVEVSQSPLLLLLLLLTGFVN